METFSKDRWFAIQPSSKHKFDQTHQIKNDNQLTEFFKIPMVSSEI